MWLFPLLFFAYQFILRLWPGLQMQSIMQQFAIDASGFGLLAACYYYGYAGMQIPLAILLERFGAKKVIFAFAILCGLAMMLFTTTHHFYLALLSRFLIGAGSAVGFLGVSKVVSEWFDKEHYATMIGLSFSFGLLGAVYGGKPLSVFLSHYDEQTVALTLSLIAIAIAFFVLFVLKSASKTIKEKSTPLKKADFAALLSSKNIWILAIANLLLVGALEGFADVWGVPFLMTAYSFSKSDAAFLSSFIFIGMLFGGPVLALLSRWLGNYRVLALCGVGLALAFVLLLSLWVSSWWMLSSLFFVIGLLCCYQVLIFATGSALVSAELLGLSIAFLNCVNMLGGSFFHTLIGSMMDTFWSGTLDAQGMRLYSLASFQHALSLIPVCACIGTLLIYLLGRKAKPV
jgi:predicted MFS family arabinose efflux permease